MSRKPLSVRNQVDSVHGYKASSKKHRLPFSQLKKSELVSSLNQVFKEATTSGPTLTVCEDDLIQPVPEKVQQIYFKCLNFAFEVTPEALKQPSFNLAAMEHRELCDDFVTRFQFFRIMKKFMNTCLVPDFRLEDLMCPEPKRTNRNLSAIINFFKYHFNVFTVTDDASEYQEASDNLQEAFSRLDEENVELRQRLEAMEQQRLREHEQEEELKQCIVKQGQEMHALQMQQDAYQQQLQAVCDERAKREQNLAELTREMEKWTVRTDDLKKQVVSSPDKLKALLVQLQQQVEDAKEAAKETETLIRMWESLASRAHQIPPVLKGVNEDFEILLSKVEKGNEYRVRLEAIEEQVRRKQQLLREATSKHQNLLRHLKLVEEENDQVNYDGHKVPHFHARDDLQRDVYLLEQELHQREVTDEKLKREMQEDKEKLIQVREQFQKAFFEVDEMSAALKAAFQKEAKAYDEVMERFDI